MTFRFVDLGVRGADGVGLHSDPAALHRDRVRQNRLAQLCWVVLRCTWADLRHDPAALAALVTRLLHDRPRASRPPLAQIDERGTETAG